MQLKSPMLQRNGIKLGMESELLLRVDRRSFEILCLGQKFARWEHRKMWSTDRGRSSLQ